VAWRNNADVIERYVKKGTQLYIEGKLRTRQWTDQTGNKRYTTEVQVDTFQLLGKRPDAPQQGGYPAPQGAPQQAVGYPGPQGGPGYSQPSIPQPPVVNEGGPEDDLPF
jgi:single-strand DNA-binding protein